MPYSFRARRRLALLALPMTFPVFGAEAPDADESSVALETVIVESGPFAGRGGDELTRPVSVIYGDELARKNKGTIGDLLANEPGVANSGFGPGVGRPVIRGQSGPRVSVLQNGISSMDASTVSADHAVGLDAGDAEQVEIIKGPATLIYGSGAIGGIVNVVDGRLPDAVREGFSGRGDFSLADNADERRGQLSLGYGLGDFQFQAAYGSRRADEYEIPGFAESAALRAAEEAEADEDHDDEEHEAQAGVLENSDVDTRSGSVSLSWITPARILGLAVTRFESYYGVPGHGHGDEEEEHEDETHEAEEAHEEEAGVHIDLEQTRYDLRADWLSPLPALDKIKIRAGYNDYEHAEIEGSGEVGTLFRNQEYEARAELIHAPLGAWRGNIGLHYGHRDFDAIGEEALAPPTLTQTLGLFAVEEYAFGEHRLELGARVERARIEARAAQPNTGALLPDRDFTPLSLSAGTVFALGHEFHLRLNLARSQRAPSSEELYSFGAHEGTQAYERGNLALGEETSNNAEISLERHHGRLRMSASIYYNRVQDYVYEQFVDTGLNADGSGTGSSDGIADRVNDEGEFEADGELLLFDFAQEDADFYGFETQLRYTLLQSGPLTLSGQAFYDVVHGELKSDDPLPRITPSRIGGGLDASLYGWSGSLALTRVGRQSDVAPLEMATDAYTLLSADLGYTVFFGSGSSATLYLRGRNLLDEEAREHTSFLKDLAPLPGRTVTAGLRFDFGA